jgi:hypothetical protein
MDALALVLALFLLSFPDAAPEVTPGFGTLAELYTPRTYGDGKYLFWHALGSVVFIFAVRRYLFALWGVTNR